MERLAGRTATVTGGGIGDATYCRFAVEGVKVAIFDLLLEAMGKARARPRKHPSCPRVRLTF